jgi:signal peptidase I
MYPTIKDGETKSCEVEDDYCVGDIVAFNCKNQIVSHRIVGELFGKYVTKGDNNIMPDFGLVDSSEILCKVQTSAGIQ